MTGLGMGLGTLTPAQVPENSGSERWPWGALGLMERHGLFSGVPRLMGEERP